MLQNMIRGSELKAEVSRYLAARAGGWRVDLERLENNAPPLPTLRRSARVPAAERRRVERERLLTTDDCRKLSLLASIETSTTTITNKAIDLIFHSH